MEDNSVPTKEELFEYIENDEEYCRAFAHLLIVRGAEFPLKVGSCSHKDLVQMIKIVLDELEKKQKELLH